MGIAVGIEVEEGVLLFANQPDLTLAAADQILFDTVLWVELGNFSTEFDDVAVSIFPLSEKFEVFNQFFDVHILIRSS